MHVVDALARRRSSNIDAVARRPREIGAANIPELLAFNKIDRLAGSESAPGCARRQPGAIQLSALTGEGVPQAMEPIAAALPNPPVEVEALVPWARGDLVAQLYREAEVLKADAEPDGTRVRARVGLALLAALRPFLAGRPDARPP